MAGHVEDPKGTVSNANTAEETKITSLEDFTLDPITDRTKSSAEKAHELAEVEKLEGNKIDVEKEKQALEAQNT